MGLLDNFVSFAGTDQGIGLAQGLLSANGSQGIAAGLAGMQQAKKQQQEFALRKQMHDMQMQSQALQLQNAQRAAANEQSLRDIAPRFARSPEQANAMSMGPSSPDNPMQQVQPGYDFAGYANAVASVDPMKSLAIQQSLAKESSINKLDPKDYTPQSLAKFSMTRNYADLQTRDKKEIGPNGQAYNPFTINDGTVLADANKPFLGIGQDGKPIANAEFQRYEINKAGAGAARTNVSVDAAPKAFWQDFGKSASDSLFKEREAATGAASTLQNIGELRKAVQAGVYQGTGADLKLGAAKALNALGMNVDPAKVGNSEQFAAIANNFVLGQIKTLGVNPSNADRTFIEKTVPRLTTDPTALPMLLDFMEGKATQQVTGFNSKIKGVQGQSNAGFLPYSLEVPVPETTPKSSAPLAPSKQFKIDGGASVIGQLGADGKYYVTRNGKKFRIED